jgi:HNH endonuclease
VSVRVKGRHWELEHRLVMAEKLGRELSTDEHVHHINGDKQDNRPDNLAIMTQSEHMRGHMQERYSRWSPDADACELCGTNIREHKAHNLCDTCYQRVKRSIAAFTRKHIAELRSAQ